MILEQQNYLLRNNGAELLDRIYKYSIELFVDHYKIEPKKIFRKKKKYAGEKRNDLPGHFKVRGNKICIRYKNKDISTGCNNTPQGWKAANKFWEQKVDKVDDMIARKISSSDTIENTYKKFIDYKKQYDKISTKTIRYYNIRIKTIFNDMSIILTESNVKNALDNFIKTTELSDLSINYFLIGVQTF